MRLDEATSARQGEYHYLPVHLGDHNVGMVGVLLAQLVPDGCELLAMPQRSWPHMEILADQNLKLTPGACLKFPVTTPSFSTKMPAAFAYSGVSAEMLMVQGGR